MKHPTITREEYKALLDNGWTFRDAFLYEPQNNLKAAFVHVQLAPTISVFKRCTKRGED